MFRTAALLALLVTLPQQPGGSAPDREDPPDAAVGAAEVTVDFVVRDSEGGLILDLKPEEVEVYEDGVLQDFEAPGLVSTAAPEERKAVVALVFDRLGRDSGRRAADAAAEWARLPAAVARQVGVFRIGRGLETLQGFTNDGATIGVALHDVQEPRATSDDPESARDRLRTLLKEQTEAPGEDLLRSAELSMVQATEALERDQPGLATTNALLALVNGLQVAPGRKAVVVFADGFALADSEEHSLRTVISAANRGGVSFYPVDASGRRFAYDKDLGTLARDTGGFLISDRNDIVAGLRRVEEELGAHYRLTFVPASEDWDGGYRKLDIRVRRTGLEVQGRHGYFAVRTPTPTPLLEHEAPVLAALERAPAADQVPLRVNALQFPDPCGATVVAVVADLPAGGPSLRTAEGDDSTWTQDFTVVALVRDEAARIVHKSSHRYVLSWGQESLDDVEVGRVLFEREALLSPGTYTVEVVVRDAHSGRLGVARLPLELGPVEDDELRVSSLMVVGHAEPRASGAPSPLFHEGVKFYPNLGDPVSRDQGLPLAFLFTLRPGRALAAATVELLQGNRSILQSSIALPSPDPSGQMRVVSGLQLDDLEPGPYVLRLRVSNARGFHTRSTPFTLGP